MAGSGGKRQINGGEASAFAANSWRSRIAQLIVLDMVLWPGALFLLATTYVAYQVRERLLVLAVLAFATLFSAAVGVRQWRVMLRSVFPPPPNRRATSCHAGEDSPRLTGRGGTEGEC